MLINVLFCFISQEQLSNVTPNLPSNIASTSIVPSPTAPDLLDQVMYPNDFPTNPSKSNFPSSGLLLPDVNKTSNIKYALRIYFITMMI